MTLVPTVGFSKILRAVAIVAMVVAMLGTSMTGVSNASENVRVDMKVLLMASDATDGGLDAWKAILDRAGMPYDVFMTMTEPPITAEFLSSGVDHARYQAVILANGQLLHCNGTCEPTFSTEEWATLDAYQAEFGIRRISSNIFPDLQHGFNVPITTGDVSGVRTNLTASGLAEFPSLAGPVDLGIGTFGSYATPHAGASFTTLLTGPSGSSMVGVHLRTDGIEDLVITMAMGEYSLHTYVLGHGLLKWATHGLYLGYERNYFTADFDDIFLPDDRWDMIFNTTHEDECDTLPCIRMEPDDVTRALNWQTSTGLTMNMVWNGVGSQDAIEAPGSGGVDPLTDSLVANRYEFRWINHQWSHDEFEFISQKRMIEEIQLNTNWARDLGIPFDPKELVTGSHSGLHTPETAGALKATGVEWLASDNSREPDPYPVGDAMTLPRHPANVYYNVGTLEEQLDEYNYIFYENCNPLSPPPGTTCIPELADQATYVDNEATIMLPHLLGNDPRPHYFHQSNLAEEGTFYPVADEVLDRYNLYMATPLVQPNYRAASDAIRMGDDWADASGGTDAYFQLGKTYLTSPVATNAPMTGVPDGDSYGGEISTWVTLRPNSTRVIDLDGFAWPKPDAAELVESPVHQDLTRMVDYGGFIWRLPETIGSE